MNDWPQYVPPPPPLTPGQEWHVYISYRSTHRPWVIQLYDVLRGLNYKAFVDQFVLAPGQPLTEQLESVLRASASGVLVWSSRTSSDVEWCRREFDTMSDTAARTPFRFVVARLDSDDLPVFAANRLWVDFSDSREGPRGVSLLLLLYGLTGRPLPDEAVRLAAEVDHQAREALSEVRDARAIGDRNRLKDLANSSSLAWTTSPLLGCIVAEGLISLGDTTAAVETLLDLAHRYPASTRPRQLLGLALARSGNWAEAQRVLGKLIESGQQDPESLGIYARTWMDRYRTTGERRHLEACRQYYKLASDTAPGDYYTAINVASKSLQLGDEELATAYAARCEDILGGMKSIRDDYWSLATRAEAMLIQRKFAEAEQLYAAAIGSAPEETNSHQSTWDQAEQLLRILNAPQEVQERIRRTFSHVAEGNRD